MIEIICHFPLGPFKADTAYMEVPRCDTCKYWGQPIRMMNGRGACTKIHLASDLLLITDNDFGCVLWEAK